MIGCSAGNPIEIIEKIQSTIPAEIEIDINTTRNLGNILSPINLQTRTGDPFTEIRETESSESVVLPELQPHIWIGNILKSSSVADCNYKPLVYPRIPINVTLTLPGTIPKQIFNPSYTGFMQYVQEQITKGSFSQNGEFNFTIEQFSSYNELKVAFGSNANTQVLFWGSSSASQKEDQFITKATGLYVKFYQTSFKAIMDYPNGQIASIPENMVDSAVYINSVSFGRLGILTLETNAAVQYSKETTEKVFRKLFSSGSSSLTVEEKKFLDGCDFKVYLIGGNSTTMVESFTGYGGFVQHIKRGSFSKNEPGTPLFCTFNNVKDNSPFKIKFKYNIKSEPLYVELVHKPKSMDGINWGDRVNICGYGDLYLYFYKNQAKVPTIADPSVKFKVKVTERYQLARPNEKEEISTKYYEFQNAGYQTSMLIFPAIKTRHVQQTYFSGPPWDRDREWGHRTSYQYYVENSSSFVTVGYNPIDDSNTLFSKNYK